MFAGSAGNKINLITLPYKTLKTLLNKYTKATI